jgi:hypothetical protein
LAAEKPRSGGGELATIERWPDALGELHTRVADRFHRLEVRERARRYLAGLLGRLWTVRTAGRWPNGWVRWDPKGHSAS